MKVNVLGVKIDDITLDQALKMVEKWIYSPGKYYIVTPNPEFLVAAQKDPEFKKILNGADLAIPDGAGLRLSGKIKNIFSGTDFMERLVKVSSEKGLVVGFLGSRGQVAVKCAERLKEKYPNLKVGFADNGGEVDKAGNVIPARFARRAQAEIHISPVDILFVAFGHIKQEKWIAKNLKKIPVHVVMGVGGAFDYLSNTVPRAPIFIRKSGFEWLFRLILQPWRISRQLSLVKYLLDILAGQLHNS